MIEDGSRGSCYENATLAYLIKHPHSVPTEDLKNNLKILVEPPPPPPHTHTPPPPPTTTTNQKKNPYPQNRNPCNIIFKFKILTPYPPPPHTHTHTASHTGVESGIARLSYQQYHQIVNKYVAISQICRGFKRLKYKERDRDTASKILQQKSCWPKHQTNKH